MTKEEVEKRAEGSLEKRSGTYGYNNFSICAKPYKDGFFDGYFIGAKENGAVWHDLRRDPRDLPKEAGEYICIYSYAYGGDATVIAEWHIQYQDEGEGHYLKMDENFVYNGIGIDEIVIAWCEIPKFEGE